MGAEIASKDLAEKLVTLGVADSLRPYPNCYPEINPVDIYRAHLTTILAEVTGVDASIIYPALQWTQTLDKGDLVLPVPALRVKGKKPAELAAEWAEKVNAHRHSKR
jgi:arginyl-tRNA synthetase